MKLYKHILTSFFTAIITVLVVYGGYTIYAETEYSFDKTNLNFDQAQNCYQGDMNSYFNDRVKKLNLLMENNKTDFYTHKDFNPPKDIELTGTKKDSFDKIVEKCGDNNVSTYCVSMGALDRYLAYIKNLDRIKGELLGDNASAYWWSTGAMKNLIFAVNERNQRAEAEEGEAKQAMLSTVAAYNEYRLAYPMHKKYEEIIKNLVEYKDATEDIRQDVMQFPGKFIDSTTSQCK